MKAASSWSTGSKARKLGSGRRSPQHSCAGPRARERGVALVITLVLLSVITFMTVAFLVLSRGQQSSVATQGDQTVTRLATDTGLDRAEAELVSALMGLDNPFSFDLLVSTNYINPRGLQPGFPASPTNVNFEFSAPGHNPLTVGQQLENLGNLLFNPRVPVYIVTNRTTGSNEFRFYLDLNRNGRYDPNGLSPVIGYDGNALRDSSGVIISNTFVGDPEWIGVLEFPDRMHSAANRFVSRYAYIVLPASKTLDVNYIHNQARNPNKTGLDRFGRDFNRNQGVGTWEINLGAFLYDLNTNLYAWGGRYVYTPLQTPYVDGNAFVDAGSIMAYRYAGSYKTLYPVTTLLGVRGDRAFWHDGFDSYTAALPMTGVWPATPDPDGPAPDRTVLPWCGAESTNHFLSVQELFDRTKVNPFNLAYSFADRMAAVSTNYNSYDRTTYYRLLSQLGTDSTPEPPKLNLNYVNVDASGAIVPDLVTNFDAWAPENLFINIANTLFTNAGFNPAMLSANHIQIYPTNFYTPSVHRLLQLAANICDATTNRNLGITTPRNDFPVIFRPLFTKTNGVISIAGYRELQSPQHSTYINSGTAPIMRDLSNPADVNNMSVGRDGDLVYGVPLIVGAKQGFPNFNEFGMQTRLAASRLLEFRRAAGDPNTAQIIQTNQMYTVGISNTFGIEAWNSYSAAYPRNLQLIAAADMTAYMTNEIGFMFFSNRISRGTTTNIARNTWLGWASDRPNSGALNFVLPFYGPGSELMFLTNSSYLNHSPWLLAQTHDFERGQGFYVPRWYLNLNTRLRVILYDQEAGRIVDYVNLNYTEPTIDLMAKLAGGINNSRGQLDDYDNPNSMWYTNRLKNATSLNAATYGIFNQIQAGLNGVSDWKSYSLDPYSGRDVDAAIDGFRKNLMNWAPKYNQGRTFTKTNVFYAPLMPYRPIYVHTTWQANDPLVHYTVGDLMDVVMDETNRVNFDADVPSLKNIGSINTRYQPWGYSKSSAADRVSETEFGAKDPGVRRSDDWQFPTNKFPNIGWLGRVHRGTPWQTVYLKSVSTNLNFQQWKSWTGNPVSVYNAGQINTNVVPFNVVADDAFFTSPTNDWHIVDLFSAASIPSATRGQLSINQTNLAAWSAVLSGVNVLSNINSSGFIQPAGYYTEPPALVRIVQGINQTRTRYPNSAFQRLGDVLATPELTMASPYLSGDQTVMSDAVYERIPQQILGLLKGGEPPRFVVYAYGQALKPADKSIMADARFPASIGLCTNYQVTAEAAVRAVVRIDGWPTNVHIVVESFILLPPD